MSTKRITKKILKITGPILGAIMVLLVAFHFWFINHAEELVEDLVSSQSNGKLHLKVKKFKFNWFSKKIELHDAVFFSTDTVEAPVSYRFAVHRLKVQVNAVWPLVFEKKFDIDSLHLFDPDISVTKLRATRDTASLTDTSLSIPQEMGRIYHSIQDALQELKVERFQIDNGKFSLINKTHAGERPVQITNLNFHLDKLRVDSSQDAAEKKIFFSDNVALQTTNQDIVFPDGRHRLSFSNFRINIRNKLAEFDSCTIIATKGDSSKSSFRIFFDKLRMTNIDFDTLYRAEVIKADSVYCINPRFRLDVDLEKRTGPVTPPKLDELIQQLTGDLQVAFVVVQNGSFDINTMREGRPSSFTSDNNNFELQGLRIREKAPRPFMVDRFAMAIRNYENFLRDSAYSIQFDSILINNNRISLSNFSYQELSSNKVVNTLRMPQFELYGLSWDDLVFDQRLKAQSVTLYKPVIDYDLTRSKNKSGKDVFATLAGIGQSLQLNNLNMVDGKVNLLFKNNASLRLENATMLLLGQQLVASRKISAIKRSVDALRFQKGIFRMGDFKAELSDARFTGSNNHIEAGSLHVTNKGNLDITAADVAVQSMVFDDQLQHIIINGMSWKEASVKLSQIPGTKANPSQHFTLHNLRGSNTVLDFQKNNKHISGVLSLTEAAEISLQNGQLNLTGARINGRDMLVTDSLSSLLLASVELNDQGSSFVKGMEYRLFNGIDSSRISIPALQFTPDINAILQGRFKASNVRIDQPLLQLQLASATKDGEGIPMKLPELDIDRLVITQPDINFSNRSAKGVSGLQWPKQDQDIIELEAVKTSSANGNHISVGAFGFVMNQFVHHGSKGKNFNAGNGKLSGQLHQLQFQENEAGGWDWQGKVTTLTARDFIIDSLGKKSGRLMINSAQVNDLSLSSAYLLNLRELVKHNSQFRLRNITGSYIDSADHFNWYNMGYDKKERVFSLDSFSFAPVLGLEAYLAKQKYQSDYMTARTGAISTGPFDIERILRDTVLDIGTVNIDNGYLTDHRDQRMVREPGIVRPLLIGMLKSIPIRIQADTVKLNNAFVQYQEVHEKTGNLGQIVVDSLNGRVTNMRNFNLTEKDSLHILASGLVGGTIRTNLSVRESYTDSMGGFLMTVQMGPADLTVLNPILGALASAELKSGLLDTMSMSVVGREELAFGEMKMEYHDLKVRVLKDGDRTKKSFFNGIINFLANTIIKNKSSNRSGRVFFKRLKDRSPINYLVKITLSGVISNVGVGKTKKQARAYKKEIKSRPLPPVQPVQL